RLTASTTGRVQRSVRDAPAAMVPPPATMPFSSLRRALIFWFCGAFSCSAIASASRGSCFDEWVTRSISSDRRQATRASASRARFHELADIRSFRMIHSRTNDGGTSCLMVTQPHREALMRRSVECFRRQTHAPRELVVVHSGDAGFHRRVLDMAHVLDDARMTVVAAASSRRLGALRNLAVAHARCEFVCQWDDDDLHHPEYLARQHTNLLASGADFSF